MPAVRPFFEDAGWESNTEMSGGKPAVPDSKKQPAPKTAAKPKAAAEPKAIAKPKVAGMPKVAEKRKAAEKPKAATQPVAEKKGKAADMKKPGLEGEEPKNANSGKKAPIPIWPIRVLYRKNSLEFVFQHADGCKSNLHVDVDPTSEKFAEEFNKLGFYLCYTIPYDDQIPDDTEFVIGDYLPMVNFGNDRKGMILAVRKKGAAAEPPLTEREREILEREGNDENLRKLILESKEREKDVAEGKRDIEITDECCEGCGTPCCTNLDSYHMFGDGDHCVACGL